jgi:hypothetical protein
MKYLLLCHVNNGYAKALQCYIYTYIACRVDVKHGVTYSKRYALKGELSLIVVFRQSSRQMVEQAGTSERATTASFNIQIDHS